MLENSDLMTWLLIGHATLLLPWLMGTAGIPTVVQVLVQIVGRSIARILNGSLP